MNELGIEILEEIGEGKFGRVFLGKKNDEKIAIKMIENKKSNEHLQEIEIHSKLKHPNIIQLLEYIDIPKKCTMILLEYAPLDVFDRLEIEDTLNIRDTCNYILQITSAIKYLHDRHILHRDLKVENLLISFDYQIKIADFGFAVDFSDGPRTTFLGTNEYIAPEMLRGDEYTTSVDVWAIGILIFEFLYGETPFAESNKRKIFSKIRRNDYTFPDPRDYPDDHEYILNYQQYLQLNQLIRQILKPKVHERLSLENIIESVQNM